MKNYIIAAAVALVTLSGCGAAKMNFNVLTPAPINVPQDIQTIAIIDRSLPETTDLNRLESILTMEGPKADRAARQQVMEGLKFSLNSSTRYNVILTNEMFIGSSRGSVLPDPLPWNLIDEMAARYSADVIVCLEAFDSDFIIAGAKLPSKDSPGAGAGGIATVNCGFRMYWPAQRSMPDEYKFSHSMNWNSSGPAILAAINTIKVKNDAINSASREAGLSYGRRITPTWYRVSRDYFKKGGGSADLEAGARMMQLNDWDKAIEALTRATETGSTKARGRAAHNLAVVNEILGDLPAAKEWTTVSWGMYREKKSRDYGYILTNRIIEEENLKDQLRK
ncbi:MAG: hypothetical protein IH591_17840 [Bacteroidales bacterium]|nr:hypothetical protein [Bacteroidales bacterium]